MKTLCLNAALFLFIISLGAQNAMVADSATVIIKNISHKKITFYMASIKGYTIGGKKLKPSKSHEFKIPLTGSNLFRFNIYTDRKRQNRYSVEPMDYFEQVSEMKIEAGTYLYEIDLNEDASSLNIKLTKTR
ncbi:MAG: hypothetical protein IT236_00975 [Bacteroidia bacterium]|nr:hypothetical protein [Bacteroidia bacterium]